MKDRMYVDMGQIMDEIFEATQTFGDAFKKGFSFSHRGDDFAWNENVDFYPRYSYPPANVYMKKDRTLVFEFALAGFGQESVDVQFQGDYMVLNVTVPEHQSDEEVRYFKRRLKMKEIRDQKYFAPRDKFDQENARAVFKNGLLRITVPGKEAPASEEGIKVDIADEDSDSE